LAPQTTTKPPRRTQPLQEQTPAAIRLPQRKLIFFNAINHMHDIGFKIIASHSISQKQGPKSKPLPKRNIVKPELTTTSKQRPPVYNGHHFLVPILDFIT